MQLSLAMNQALSSSLFASGALPHLQHWLEAARTISTIDQFEKLQPLAQEVAAHVIDAPYSDLFGGTVAQLQSNRWREVLTGLAHLQEEVAYHDELSTHLDEQIPAELQNALDEQAERFRSSKKVEPKTFEPITPSAKNSKSIMGYGVRRLYRAGLNAISHKVHGEPTKLAQELAKFYSHDLDKTEGHYSIYPRISLPPSSSDGELAFEKEHRAELYELAEFVDRQLKLNSSEAQKSYMETRESIISILEEARHDYDQLVKLMETAETKPEFKIVSDIYWVRDNAIRNRPVLNDLGIGPWEYDLLKQRQAYDKDIENDSAADQDHVRIHTAEWSYIMRKFGQDYNQAIIDDDKISAEQLRKERFTLEPLFMQLARHETLSAAKMSLVSKVSDRYLAFLQTDLSQLKVIDIKKLDLVARQAYLSYADELHQVHLQVAHHALKRFYRDQQRIHKINDVNNLFPGY